MTDTPLIGERLGSVGVFGDVDVNLIDGSSVWLVSLCSVLDRVGVKGHVLLKVGVERDVLASELGALESFRVWEPSDVRVAGPLRGRGLTDALRRVDAEADLDVLIVRGLRAAREVAGSGAFDGRLWPYLTDVPQSVDEMTPEVVESLREVFEVSGRVLCQTESLRSFLVSFLPEADRKMVLLPPMVADQAFVERGRVPAEGGLRLFYAGKLAPLWGIEEMLDQVGVVRETHPEVGLVVAGDKIHRPADDPGFRDRVVAGLAGEGVTWLGGVGREEVFAALAEVDVALSVRDASLNTSREVSTKLLEYAAARVPVMVNRTLAHEELLGVDYPLLVDDSREMAGRVAELVDDPDGLTVLSDRMEGIAERFSFDAVGEDLKPALTAAIGRGADLSGRRVVVAGHDLKFATLLIDGLRTAGAEVEVDLWSGGDRHDEARSSALVDWADDVICEWCLANAVWYSRRKRSGQRLWVRFHRTELTSSWPEDIVIDAVDGMVFVGEHVLREAVERFGWSSDRLRVISNLIDEVAFDRTKLSGADHTLGMLGFLPRLKRLDLALDLVEILRARDRRYRLVLKGRLPWELPWVWGDAAERTYFEQQFAKIRSSPLLGNAVVFDRQGDDVPSWFRKIGFVLSLSDVESFHLAMVEGMASRAVPIVSDRAGVEAIVSTRWVIGGPAEAATRILALDSAGRVDAGQRARDEVSDRYPLKETIDAWQALLTQPTQPPSPVLV